MLPPTAVFPLIRQRLADELDLPVAAIVGSTRLREDLGVDSLDLVGLLLEVEERFGVRITDYEAAQILTVSQAVSFIVANAARDR